MEKCIECPKMERCINCNKSLSDREQVLCKRCIKKQKKNKKLQKLLRESVRIR